MRTVPEIHQLFKHAKQAPPAPCPSTKIGLMADTATQILATAMRGVAHFWGVRLELFEGEYDQIDLQVLNPDSELHSFAPEAVVLFFAGEKFAARFAAMPPAERSRASGQLLGEIAGLHRALSVKGCQTVCFNLADPGDGVFGHYASKTNESLSAQIRRVNLGLMELAQAAGDFHVFDLARVQVELGRQAMHDPRLYCTAKMPLTPDATRQVVMELTQMLMVGKGGGRKCVILDLDNTLWGGVIGDDGLERIQLGELGLGQAFNRFQAWLKQLKERGIVLCVCSKNNEETAREPFLRHPDMVLRLEDIAVFVANWKDKAANIRAIKAIVDVDYSAMVFLDDNPVERALVRESFPSMTVPELPEDPCDYLPFVQRLNLFETASCTAQDAQRTRSYQAESQRRTEREKFVDEADFLRSLEMVAKVRPFTPFLQPRIAQLTQRSNQFNLRTVRYTETRIAELARSPSHRTFAFELRDKYGDYGMISVVILELRDRDCFIDTWLMSCRVLGRGMENFVLNTLAEAAVGSGAERLVGEYIATAKNGMVKEHYPKLSFEPSGNDTWTMEVAGFAPCSVHIRLEKEPHAKAA